MHYFNNEKIYSYSEVEVVENPLIIPLKENKKSLVDRIKQGQDKSKNDTIKSDQEDSRPDSELTIDELAARELLRGNQVSKFSVKIKY